MRTRKTAATTENNNATLLSSSPHHWCVPLIRPFCAVQSCAAKSKGAAVMQKQALTVLREDIERLVTEKDYVGISQVLKKSPFWQPNALQENAINRCKAYCQREGEIWIKGWVCVSVNEWGSEQERIILLNNKAYYRIKYDYIAGRILHFRRTPFVDMMRIEHGQFQITSWSISGSILRETIEKSYAFRVFKKSADGNQSLPTYLKSVFGSLEPEKYRTYIPVPQNTEVSDSARQIEMRELLEEIIGAFSAVTRVSGGFIFPFVNAKLEWENPGGLASATYNSLGIGKQTI